MACCFRRPTKLLVKLENASLYGGELHQILLIFPFLPVDMDEIVVNFPVDFILLIDYILLIDFSNSFTYNWECWLIWYCSFTYNLYCWLTSISWIITHVIFSRMFFVMTKWQFSHPLTLLVMIRLDGNRGFCKKKR